MGKITFTYSAQNREGLPVRGSVEAADKEDALNKLRALEVEGLQNISIENAIVEKDAPAQTPEAPVISKIATPIALICILLLAIGMVRIYFGKKTGVKIVLKNGFSLQDTLVDVDRFTAMPRSVLEKNHPGVKKQLETMGIRTKEEEETARLLKNISKKPSQEPTEKTSSNALGPTPSAVEPDPTQDNSPLQQ